MQKRVGTSRLGALFGAITVLCWASFNVAAKVGIDAGMSPAALSFLRYVTPGIVALPVLIWLRRQRGGTYLPVYKLCVLAVLGGPLFGLIAVAGYQHAPLSYGLLFAPVAVFVSGTVFGAVLLKECITVRRMLGAFIMFGGLALLVGFEATGLRSTWGIGVIMFVIAGSMWGGYTVLLRHWSIGMLEGTSAIASIGALVAAVVLGPAAWSSLVATDTTMLLTQLLMQGVVGGILSVIALVAALRRLTAQTVAMLPTFTPAIALLIAWIVFGTPAGTMELIGAAVIFVGFAASTHTRASADANLRQKMATSLS